MRYLLAALLILATACNPDAETSQDGSGDHVAPDSGHALCEVIEAQDGLSASLWDGSGWYVCAYEVDGWCRDGMCEATGRECLDSACRDAEAAQVAPCGASPLPDGSQWWIFDGRELIGACSWDPAQGWSSGEGEWHGEWWECGRSVCPPL